MNYYGIVIQADPVTRVETIPGWVAGSYLLLTWDNGQGGLISQSITDQTRAIILLKQAAAFQTPLMLLSASVEG